MSPEQKAAATLADNIQKMATDAGGWYASNLDAWLTTELKKLIPGMPTIQTKKDRQFLAAFFKAFELDLIVQDNKPVGTPGVGIDRTVTLKRAGKDLSTAHFVLDFKIK